MKYLIMAILLPSVALAWKRSDKPNFKVGQSVRMAACNSRSGKHWVSDGYPRAHLEPTNGCGKNGTIIDGPYRDCAPPELRLDSCDPYRYRIRIHSTDEIIERDETQIGKGKFRGNTMMDIFDLKCNKKGICEPKEK